ncbi:MAG: SDR family NAD(P)-dependent oxidoreductase [Burkholderiales bacterium]|nr:SDR family NAD(P)-dependent oxidoreductase [Burkholderiales bacterium]
MPKRHHLKPLKEQTVVITGASSGIGLATALGAADQGARLVLAARDEAALNEIVAGIRDRGGEAIAVVADVGKREDVRRIAEQAKEHFGGFDTWVNNAGVSIWGRLDEVSDEDNHRLMDTNFWGVVYGCEVAVEHLRHTGGAIVNLGSMLSDVSVPLQGMYCASKHAVKGYTDALRLEMEEAGIPISVTLIKPAAINTHFAENARNYTGLQPKLPPPVYKPEEAAAAILYAAETPIRDLYIGSAARMFHTLGHAAPRLMDRISEKFMVNAQLSDQPARDEQGALHQPSKVGSIEGETGHRAQRSVYTRAKLNPKTTMAALVAAGLAGWWLVQRRPNALPFVRDAGGWLVRRAAKTMALAGTVGAAAAPAAAAAAKPAAVAAAPAV